MKYVLIAVTAVMVLQTGVMSAFAAQMSFDAVKNPDAPEFTFQRTVSIEYPDGGTIADSLRGKHNDIHLKENANPDMIEKINRQIAGSGSHVRVLDAHIEYSAEIDEREHDASIDYKITMVPTIDGFLIREYSENSPALFDVSWRGLRIDEPVFLGTGDEKIDINSPNAFLQKEFPDAYEKIKGTEAEKILGTSMIDSSGLLLPLAKWHTLTDPTAIIADASKYGFKGNVMTTISMGESTIFTPTREKILEAEIVADKKYRIRTLEAADNANLFIPGYAAPTLVSKFEMIGTSPKAPVGSTNPNQQGQFPIFVMYSMAAMGAVGAVGFFWWSSRKAKKETNIGQTGIDPRYLRGVSTSEASGSYHTNRGEAHLIGEHRYEQTQSNYEKPK